MITLRASLVNISKSDNFVLMTDRQQTIATDKKSIALSRAAHVRAG